MNMSTRKESTVQFKGRISNKKRDSVQLNETNIELQEKKKSTVRLREDDPQYLATAIRKNIVALVEGMPFNESSIPDALIAEGCITEDECKLVREKKERKDQVRKIVNLIKDRSFPAIRRFLKIVGRECSTIVDKIWNDYDNLKKTNLPLERCCGMCRVKKHVDVKYVIDVLWQESVITTALYENVSDTEQRKGSQNDLWDSVFDECRNKEKNHILLNALKCKGHYNHIADELSAYFSLNQRECIRCACIGHGNVLCQTGDHDSSTSYYPDSSSSIQSLTGDSVKTPEKTSNECQKSDIDSLSSYAPNSSSSFPAQFDKDIQNVTHSEEMNEASNTCCRWLPLCSARMNMELRDKFTLTFK